MNGGPNSLTWDAQLLSYWISRNSEVFQDQLVNLFNNLRGGYLCGSSRTRRNTGGKITTFKLVHPVFDGGARLAHVPLMFLSEWRVFPSAPCLAKKKLNDSSRFDVIEIARVAWHASFQLLLQEKTYNSVHEQTPLSNDTIDSVLRHRELGRAKDLLALPRTYVLFLLYLLFIWKLFTQLLSVDENVNEYVLLHLKGFICRTDYPFSY